MSVVVKKLESDMKKNLHKEGPPKRDINSINVGTWEAVNVSCPPASTEPAKKILSRIHAEESADYWRLRHGAENLFI